MESIADEIVSKDVASRASAERLAAVLCAPEFPAAPHPTSLFPVGHWLLFTPTTASTELGPDGHPARPADDPYADLPRRMWAGSSIAFRAPIPLEATVNRRSRTLAVVPKTGASGRLAFATVRHELSVGTEVALVEKQTIVYREPATANTASGAVPLPSAGHARPDSPKPSGWDWVCTERPNEVTLFRYSALTFNAHRIHYDVTYATAVEGYPGLVIQGPLLATLLVHGFVRTHPTARITEFTFSAKSPTFANEQIHICGRALGAGEEELAVIAPGGAVAVTAMITYA